MPSANKVELVAGKKMLSTGYAGRWVVTVAPFSVPGGFGTEIAEFDFAVVIPSGPLAGRVAAFYVGNDGAGNPASNMTAGFTFDSASPPGWASYSGVYVMASVADWDSQLYPGGPGTGTDAQIYDGTYSNYVDAAFEIDIDPSSDPNWFKQPDPPAPITSHFSQTASGDTITLALPARDAGTTIVVGLGIVSEHNYNTDGLSSDGSVGGHLWLPVAKTGDGHRWLVQWASGSNDGQTSITFTCAEASSITATLIVVPLSLGGLSFQKGVLPANSADDHIRVDAQPAFGGDGTFGQNHRAYWLVQTAEFGAGAGTLSVDSPFTGITEQVAIPGVQRQALIQFPTGDMGPFPVPVVEHGLTGGEPKFALYAWPETNAPAAGPPPPPTAVYGASAKASTGKWALRFLTRPASPAVLLAEVPLTARQANEGLVVREAVEELNTHNQMTFDYPLLDPRMRQFRGNALRCVEVQLWREGLCLWWGVCTAGHRDAQAGIATVVAQSLQWYFTGLKFGPIRTNYLLNPNFSTGDLSHWTPVGGGLTATFDPSQVIMTDPGGTPGSAHLVQAAANQDSFLSQTVSPAVDFGIDTAWFLSGWYRVDPLTPWLGPAGPSFEERGLYLERFDPGSGVVPLSGLNPTWDPITNRLDALAKWSRLETHVVIPTGSGEGLHSRIYAPGGGVNWGALRLSVLESRGSPNFPVDVTDILADIVAYAQDPAWQKVPLSIVFAQAGGAANPTTGILLERHYQLSDLGDVEAAIDEAPSIGVCDVGVVWLPSNPAAGRWFQVFPGQRGTLKANMTVELALDDVGRVRPRNLEAYLDDWDIERSANDVVWFGTGSSGSNREYGRATDPSTLGGLIRQTSVSAPADAALDSLNGRAAHDLTLLAEQVDVPQITMSAAHAETINVGDSIPVRLNYGAISETATRRIIRRRLLPTYDLMLLEVN